MRSAKSNKIRLQLDDVGHPRRQRLRKHGTVATGLCIHNRIPRAGLFVMRLETVVLRWWVVLCVILAPSSLMRAADDISAKLHAVIHGPDYKQAHWGILFVDAEAGKPIYEHNPDKLFTPASTTKLYSCAAALIALGPDYKFATPVYRRGDVKDGRLRGDLILVAQGDLTLGGRT